MVGVDVSLDAISEASRRYPGRAGFVAGGMDRLPFGARSFDVVLCLEGIEHVSRPVGVRFLSEACRVLRPGGTLLLSSPFPVSGRHSGNPFHLYEYPVAEIRELLNTHFYVRTEIQRQVDAVIVSYFSCDKPER